LAFYPATGLLLCSCWADLPNARRLTEPLPCWWWAMYAGVVAALTWLPY
jgi:uncharacterized membrane protein